MPKYRKKPVIVEAVQWFKNGDHPFDECHMITTDEGSFLSEGKVVRYYRHPGVSGEELCQQCSRPMHDHGWIDMPESGHTVCPGDFVITGVKGEVYHCNPDIFALTYETVED